MSEHNGQLLCIYMYMYMYMYLLEAIHAELKTGSLLS